MACSRRCALQCCAADARAFFTRTYNLSLVGARLCFAHALRTPGARELRYCVGATRTAATRRHRRAQTWRDPATAVAPARGNVSHTRPRAPR
eukprot:9248507-Lingulodinium_polyedra.AAC.1